MPSKPFKPFLLLAAAVVLGSTTLAQLRVDVSLVNLVATVTDERGRYVPDLSEDDFIIEEDGDRQKIVHFSFSEDVPVTMGILLDTSGSMENKISTATSAVERFVQTTHPDDEIFLMSFSNRAYLEQDFTSDRRKLSAALRRVQASGGTALYDAVSDGVKKVQKGTLDKKAILLISDGEDSVSSTSLDAARSAARKSEVLVYGLAITEPRAVSGRIPVPTTPGRNPLPLPFPFPFPTPTPQGRTSGNTGSNVAVMEELADASGGRVWVLSTENNRTQMQRALDQIADELRNQYSIGYYPPHPLKDGKWHRIEIRTRNPRYTVRTRQDYFGQ